MNSSHTCHLRLVTPVVVAEASARTLAKLLEGVPPKTFEVVRLYLANEILRPKNSCARRAGTLVRVRIANEILRLPFPPDAAASPEPDAA